MNKCIYTTIRIVCVCVCKYAYIYVELNITLYLYIYIIHFKKDSFKCIQILSYITKKAMKSAHIFHYVKISIFLFSSSIQDNM